MEKRLTRTEMLFSLGFLFMLICAVGSFFYGIKIGSEKTEAKYVPAKHLTGKTSVKVTAYQQQDLVSFYHTVFLPYREFQHDWQDAVAKLEAGLASDPASVYRELAGLADKKYKEALEADQAPVISPLLGQAQVNILKSLKLFGQAAEHQIPVTKKEIPSELTNLLHKDVYYQQAVQHSLNAQKEYYGAMLKWSASVDPDIPGVYKLPNVLEISTWKKLPLIIKNKLMADQLASRKNACRLLPAGSQLTRGSFYPLRPSRQNEN